VARPEIGQSEKAGSFTGVLEAPARVETPKQDVERVPFLEIRDRVGRELITVVELLSPSNKRPGDDREQYLTKRRELLRSRAHLVEIDLLRGGAAMPLKNRPDCDYHSNRGAGRSRRARSERPDRYPAACGEAHAGSGRVRPRGSGRPRSRSWAGCAGWRLWPGRPRVDPRVIVRA